MNDEVKEYVFGFECSIGWDNLEKTEEDKRRFCRQCDKNVYFVVTQTELNSNAVKGNCVAFRQPEANPFNGMPPVLGGYILPHNVPCKICSKLISYKEKKNFEVRVCSDCFEKQPKWWQFWK